jgi:hypothetical protein
MPEDFGGELNRDRGEVIRDLTGNAIAGTSVSLTSYQLGRDDYLKNLGIEANQLLISAPSQRNLTLRNQDIINLGAKAPFDPNTIFHVKAGISRDPLGIPLKGFVGTSNITPSGHKSQINVAYSITDRNILQQLDYSLKGLARGEIPNNTQNLLLGGPGKSETIGSVIASRIRQSKGTLLLTSATVSDSDSQVFNAIKDKLKKGDNVQIAIGGLTESDAITGLHTASRLLTEARDYKGKLSVKTLKEGVKSHANLYAFLDESFFIGGSARLTQSALEGTNVEMMLQKYDPKAVKKIVEIVNESFRDRSPEEIVTQAGLPAALLTSRLIRYTDPNLGFDQVFTTMSNVVGLDTTRYLVNPFISSDVKAGIKATIEQELRIAGKRPSPKELNAAYNERIESISQFGTYHYMFKSAAIASQGPGMPLGGIPIPEAIRIADRGALGQTIGESEWYDSWVLKSAEYIKEKVEGKAHYTTIGSMIAGAVLGAQIPANTLARMSIISAAATVGGLAGFAAYKFFNIMPADMSKFQQIDRYDPFASLVIHTLRAHEKRQYEANLLREDSIFFKPKLEEQKQGPMETAARSIFDASRNILLLGASYTFLGRGMTIFSNHVMQTVAEWSLNTPARTYRNPLVRMGAGLARSITRLTGAAPLAMVMAGGVIYAGLTGKAFPNTITPEFKRALGQVPAASLAAGTSLVALAAAMPLTKAAESVLNSYVRARQSIAHAKAPGLLEKIAFNISQLAPVQAETADIIGMTKASLKAGPRHGVFAFWRSAGTAGAFKIGAWTLAMLGATASYLYSDYSAARPLSLDQQLDADKEIQRIAGSAFRTPITAYRAGRDTRKSFFADIVSYYRDALIRAPLIKGYRMGTFDFLNDPLIKLGTGAAGAAIAALSGFSLHNTRLLGRQPALATAIGLGAAAGGALLGFNLNPIISWLAGDSWAEKHLIGKESHWTELGDTFNNYAVTMNRAQQLEQEAIRENNPAKMEAAKQLASHAHNLQVFKGGAATNITADVVQVGVPLLGVAFSGITTKEMSAGSYEYSLIAGVQGPFILQTGITLTAPFTLRVSKDSSEVVYHKGTAWEAALGISSYLSVGAVPFMALQKAAPKAVRGPMAILGKTLGAVSYLNPISLAAGAAQLPLLAAGYGYSGLKDGMAVVPKGITKTLRVFSGVSKTAAGLTLLAGATLGAADIFINIGEEATTIRRFEKATAVSKALVNYGGAALTAGAVIAGAMQGWNRGKGSLGNIALGAILGGVGALILNHKNNAGGWLNIGWQILSDYHLMYRPEDRSYKQMTAFAAPTSWFDVLDPERLSTAIVEDKGARINKLPTNFSLVSKFLGYVGTLVGKGPYIDSPNRFMSISVFGQAWQEDPELGTIPKALYGQLVYGPIDFTHAVGSYSRGSGIGGKGKSKQDIAEQIYAFTGSQKNLMTAQFGRETPRISSGMFYSGDNSLQNAPPSILIAVQSRLQTYRWALNAGDREVARYFGLTRPGVRVSGKTTIFQRKGALYALRPFELDLGSIGQALHSHFKQLVKQTESIAGDYQELDINDVAGIQKDAYDIAINALQKHKHSLGSITTAQYNKGDAGAWIKTFGFAFGTITLASGLIAAGSFLKQHNVIPNTKNFFSDFLGGIRGMVNVQKSILGSTIQNLDDLGQSNISHLDLSGIKNAEEIQAKFAQAIQTRYRYKPSEVFRFVLFDDQYFGVAVDNKPAVAFRNDYHKLNQITQKINAVVMGQESIKTLSKIHGQMSATEIIDNLLKPIETAIGAFKEAEDNDFNKVFKAKPAFMDLEAKVSGLRARVNSKATLGEELGDTLAKEANDLRMSSRTFLASHKKFIPKVFGLVHFNSKESFREAVLGQRFSILEHFKITLSELFGEKAVYAQELGEEITAELEYGKRFINFKPSRIGINEFFRQILSGKLPEESKVSELELHSLARKAVSRGVGSVVVGGVKTVGGLLKLGQGLINLTGTIGAFVGATAIFNPESNATKGDYKALGISSAQTTLNIILDLRKGEHPEIIKTLGQRLANTTTYKLFSQKIASLSSHLGWFTNLMSRFKSSQFMATIRSFTPASLKIPKFLTGNLVVNIAALTLLFGGEPLEKHVIAEKWNKSESISKKLLYGAGIALGTTARTVTSVFEGYSKFAKGLANSNNAFARGVGGFLEWGMIGATVGSLGGGYSALLGAIALGTFGAIAAASGGSNKVLSWLDKVNERIAVTSYQLEYKLSAEYKEWVDFNRRKNNTGIWTTLSDWGRQGLIAGLAVFNQSAFGQKLDKIPAINILHMLGKSQSLASPLLRQFSPIWHGNIYDLFSVEVDTQERIRLGEPGGSMRWLIARQTLGAFSTGLGPNEFIQHADLPARFFGRVQGIGIAGISPERVGDTFRPIDPLLQSEALHVAIKRRAVETDTWALGQPMRRRDTINTEMITPNTPGFLDKASNAFKDAWKKPTWGETISSIGTHLSNYFNPSASTKMPLGGKVTITSSFGYRKSPTAGASSFHKGIDLAAKIGTPIYATHDGVVISAENGVQGFGSWVRIEHRGGFKTIYGHISKWMVKAGQKVKAGQLVAYSGAEGVGTGPHLHWETRNAQGAAINPLTLSNYIGTGIKPIVGAKVAPAHIHSAKEHHDENVTHHISHRANSLSAEALGWNKGLYSEMQRSKSSPEIEKAVLNAAKATGLDKNLILATIKKESTFNPNALSGSNARGLMQIIPGWHRDTAKAYGIQNDQQFYDVAKNIAYGSHYLSDLMRTFSFNRTNDQVKIALTAYNQGQGEVTNAILKAAKRHNKEKSKVTYEEMVSFIGQAQGKEYAGKVLAALKGTSIKNAPQAETVVAVANNQSSVLIPNENSSTLVGVDDPAHISFGEGRLEGSRMAVIAGGIGYTTTGKVKEFGELLSAIHADVAPAIDFRLQGMDPSLMC